MSAYTNSEGVLSVGKYDMLVLKLQSETGLIIWTKRLGSTNNDKANCLTLFLGSLYIGGESDSPGWSTTKTDMIFIKMNVDSSNVEYLRFLGGSGED